jgi:hypothetical protein
MTNQLYLYVLLIGVGIVLFALTRPKNSSAPVAVTQQQPALDHGLRETLDEFMNELERDNARMVDSFVKLQSDYKQKLSTQQQVIQELQSRMSQLEAKIAEQQPVKMEQPAHATQPEDVVPLGFMFNEKYAKVVELSQKGLTPEQIAKATDIGMGEIQMVLGLAKREGN